MAEFFPATVNPKAAVSEAGQRLHVTGVPAWGAIVAARGKANDDHIKLLGAPFTDLWPDAANARSNLVQPLQTFLHALQRLGLARRQSQWTSQRTGAQSGSPQPWTMLTTTSPVRSPRWKPTAGSQQSTHEPHCAVHCTGLGMDLTAVGVKVQPPDPEDDPLPPAPLLVVATSDGVLCLFTFSHLSRPTQGIVRQPLPLQAAQPVLASEEVAQVCELLNS